MLYVTTRTQNDAYTTHKALTENCAQDGGRYVPFRLPVYTGEDILRFCNKGFNDTVAEILNLFFASRLQGADLDLAVGRNITQIAPMNHKILVAELWRNPEGKFSYVEKHLNMKVLNADKEPTFWVKIAIRIAVLFALYGQILSTDLIEPGQVFDISAPDDYLLTASAALYAKKMGLPINMIICSCQGGGELWDLIHRGEINTSSVAAGLIPEVERLIRETLGYSYISDFRDSCERGKIYRIGEELLPLLNAGLFCSVSGAERAKQTINSVYRSNGYLIDARTALCFSGLQDYRSKTGESGLTLILSERSPEISVREISEATGIPAEKVLLNKIV